MKIAAELRRNGDDSTARMIEAAPGAFGSLCKVMGYIEGNTTGVATSMSTTQLPGAGGGSGDRLDEFGCYDDPLIGLVRDQYLNSCGMIPNPCLAKWMAEAVRLRSYAEVRDDFSIPDLAVMPSGLVPTGLPANGVGTTIFVADFNVIPGRSILLKIQDYSLPFNPRCLWGGLAFSGGTDDQNYRHVNFKVWVGPRDPGPVFSLQGGPLREWHARRWIYGSTFRCGDSCTEIPLRSYTGCTDIDVVGITSTLYLQVDNLSTASNAITGQQIVIKLGGFIAPCCNTCAMGKACGCSGH